MMDVKQVSPGFSVSAQIAPEDMQALADAGYVAVMCNRPDGEEPGQPALADLRAAAHEAGLAFHHIPVSGGAFPAGAVAAFGAVRKGTDGPLLAYCRTGTRSITLETLANPMERSVEQRLSDAAAAGYDLSGLADALGE
jgi:sulfide:quinone oxidoreductase